MSTPPSLSSFARPHRGAIAAAAVLAVLATALTLVPYWTIVQATDLLVRGDAGQGDLMQLALLAALGVLGHYACFGASTWLAHVTAYRVLAAMRLAAARKVGRMPLGRVSGRRSGERKTVLVDDIERLEVFLAHGFPDAVAAAVVWLSMVIWMVLIDWRLTIAAVVVIPIAFWSMKLAMKDNAGYGSRYGQATAAMNAAVTEAISAMPVIRSFVAPTRALTWVREAIDRQAAVSGDLGSGFFTRASAFYVLIAANGVVVVPVATFLAATGRATTFQVVFFVVVALGANAPLVKLFLLVGQLIQIRRSGATVAELLAEPEQTDSGREVDLLDRTVRFADVHFAYDDGRQALRGVDLEARQGEVTAIVGPSGAGKSTIARLLNRSWDADGITIGGVDLREMSVAQLARTVTVVAQEPVLFSGTIAENIRLGRPDADDAAVQEAARAARVLDFLDDTPHGLQTLVGEGGAGLSGGQAQRVSIARTLLADSPVLVLDEATAYTDPDNEWALQQALSRLVAGRTVIVIAHRLSTVVDADSIVVLAEGVVEAEGRHDELLGSSDRYRRMWSDWAGIEAATEVAR